MRRQVLVALYLLAMVGLIVGLDISVLQHHFLARLLVNIGIVLVFVVLYLRFLKRP